MAAGLLAILKAWFSVCTFHLGPRDMPAAGVFFLFSIALYALASTVLLLPYETLPVAVLSGVVDTAMLLALTWILLTAHGLRARFLQTGAALAGTGFLFSLFALPLFLLRAWTGDDSPLVLLVSLLLLALIIWNIAVMAHILRHAVAASFTVGILLAIGYVWLITVVLSTITSAEAAA